MVREREISTDDSITVEGGKDKRKAVARSLNYKLGEEAEIEELDYGLTQSLSNLAKSAMNMIGACPAQLNYNFWDVILVCESLNERWAASGSERRITAKAFLEYYTEKYVTATDGISCKVWRKESFIDVVAREGTHLEVVLKELEISRFKRIASKDDKLVRLNEMLDGPVDMATVSSTVVRNLAKGKAVKRGGASRSITSDSVDDRKESDMIAEGADLRPYFEVEAGLLEEQCRAKAREKMVAIVDDEFKKEIDCSRLRVVDLESLLEVEKKSSAELQFRMFVYVHSVLRPKLVSWSVGQGGIGCPELAGVCSASLSVCFCRSASQLEEYVALISQYKDRLDNNVKLSLKLEEAKSQVEDMTVIIFCRDLALNNLTSKLAELKEKAASCSQHEAELSEYRIRALNDEISDMKCNIRALNEQLLKKEIDLDTVRTNMAVSKADFEKLNSSIAGKDLELRKSAQIRDSLISRLDRLKADLRRLKGRKAQSRADLAEVLAKNKSLVDDLVHARGYVRRVVQRDKEMNERINQLCARISELERELRIRELKYEKDLKFELDKRDGEITYGEESREMKEFLRRKEELVENMRIDLTNSWQKSIDLTRQMSERIDQLTVELAESKTCCLRDNKRVVVTHQSFMELVVHEQEKCDGEVLHQW
ncbi:hypothetical protein GIB67_010616 [Kingdonia uniflora]|uniref:Uncharacterized protein n=1 Tax=Kingdonia uniflora TaxID=39325 RepID=A0A7J7M8F8_9MAGN|nr:hypothetical protein GIB67_010616 [Kingdonia uniflora]